MGDSKYRVSPHWLQRRIIFDVIVICLLVIGAMTFTAMTLAALASWVHQDLWVVLFTLALTCSTVLPFRAASFLANLNELVETFTNGASRPVSPVAPAVKEESHAAS